ncbi:MFS transporter [Ferrigenium kumadai]|uniref:MFS transporter n=1 Tax=Ferrigenium kumadai TaxID=1682490 RepID=A0AAN1T0K0_9PROT|nr:DHA2 family efflux MFS transporter permease subunit [Ferrigenium kumadai]BBI99114.1 MFS transporter [Ferrigenium kumadai]
MSSAQATDIAGAPVAPGVLSGIRLVLATIALGLGSFMNVLDLTIVNVAVPTMAGDFAVTPTEGTWIITSYSVAEAIMLPLAGFLAGRFGEVRTFVASTLLFTLASLLCAMSFSFPMLLASRVMQGVFGASMIPLSQTLLTTIYPPHQRGLALGIWAMTTVIAPIVGPLSGGWLIDNATWHWIFLVNLPVGLLVGVSVAILMAGRDVIQPAKRHQRIDWVGLALLIVGIGSLQILLDKGNELDWFNSATIVTLGVLSAVGLLTFVVWELGESAPLVDLSLFAQRNFLVGSVCLLLGSIAFFGVVVIVPLWLQVFQGYTAFWAGKTVAFGGVLAFFLGPVIGIYINRIDARAITTFGFIVFALVGFWSARFTPDIDYWPVALSRLFMGIGIACFFLPLVTISISGLPAERVAAASGITNLMRNLGASFGTAITTWLWASDAAEQHARLMENIHPYNPAVNDYLDRLRQLGMPDDAAHAWLERMINTQSYTLATDHILTLSALLMLSLVTLIWWARPPFVARLGGH